ncbi:peptidoglycan DD-metalloendopeptidase family protein [Sphingomonas sp. GV3]|uniref:murein hydrolase activator EnvC family protein n=1 Tax=Sphingomonas sp. GV3 TaxID=3040671 RepID=UPI00280B19EC|nr:peptidoglycan DD-metalloendopeptidase family protein [Sphingomonas sp. GV3]
MAGGRGAFHPIGGRIAGQRRVMGLADRDARAAPRPMPARMPFRRVFLWLPAALLLSGSVVATGQSLDQQRDRLAAAKRDSALAVARARALGRSAAAERNAADRARAQEAALAARVTAAEANLAAAEARRQLVALLLARQRADLAARQAPVARLLAALQALARRPAIVAVAQPGSVDDLVHVRAVLGGALPAIRAATVQVRSAIDRTRALQAQAALAEGALREGRARLEADRTQLAALEAVHRARSRTLGHDAMSEEDRALALGERARDLVDRLAQADDAQATASDLAALPGPLPRPLAPGATAPAHPTGVYRLPVRGRLVTGFDELSAAGVRARGLTFVVQPGATVVAPAAGIVRYARRFRDYGTIVILDHGDGWTSLVTGLAATAVKPGVRVAAGAIIGRARGGDEPEISVELRRRGRPVDIVALLD